MVIYHAKTVLPTNGKDAISVRFPWPATYFSIISFCPWPVLPRNQDMYSNFNSVLYVSVHVDPVDGFTCERSCLSYAHIIHVQLVEHFPWSEAGIIIILLPFMVIPSIIAISSLNNQYGYISFCSSAFTDGHACNTYYDNMHRCSSSMVTDLISPALMYSGMPMYDSMAFMAIFTPSISLSVFVVWLYLDSQSSMKSCCLVLDGIPMLS